MRQHNDVGEADVLIRSEVVGELVRQLGEVEEHIDLVNLMDGLQDVVLVREDGVERIVLLPIYHQLIREVLAQFNKNPPPLNILS